MRQLNLDQLRTLIAIADLGTFSAAAQALHLAQPTVSLHISELESRLGAQLVVRGNRRVTPTAAGAALVERGRKLLRDTDEAVEAVKRQAEGRTGRVRLGTSTGVVVDLLPQVLEALGVGHAGIDVEVSILGSAEAMARLAAGTLDIGLVAMPQPPQRDLVVTPWRTQPMMAFVPPRWKAPKRATPAWLATQPLIFNDATTHMYRLSMEWFASAGFAPRARIELNYDAAIRSLVAAGYGAALLPLQQTTDAALNERMQIVPVTPKLTRRLGIAHRPHATLDGATQSVLKVLTAFRQL
ncbi:DNA-binding transcriptional LysR family regulator [Variovorax boronicumulans]|uniref:DNA-binding transcriptional LysR family regulator n=1 Tax=Variovorax boronicumulans TaxID=436515 RepID=A0AAW8E3Z6_9BURK|nr:LysR family transcriptional regulator [Variovorax boronicumulans]MDP9881781.1 DNA-binding transcriptional LysR family regulator [Variovorax boronicumulans]MDP9914970.1 DNA-binding transcriptional LysR family regulator [Variovorax boronicumulans]MDP9926906.1 DNA-binding transcriptional LysR family regulator [Variovorax boronicumulans]